MYKEQIINFINSQEQNMLRDIAELVAIPSVRSEALHNAPFGEKNAEVLGRALEICKKHGFAVKNIDNAIGFADMNGLPLELGILAHLDVVPVSDGWDTEPFMLTQKDGIIYGRGVADDKGPAIAALYAMKAVKELKIPLKKNVRLILGTDEECGSGDLPYYFNNEETPAYSISPDADFPLINTEKGRFAPEFFTSVGNEECMLPRIVGFTCTSAVNAVPDEAIVEILGADINEINNVTEKISKLTGANYFAINTGNAFKITVTGKAAHASLPESGINALTAALELISNITLADCKSTSLFRALARLFPHGDTEGKSIGIAREDSVSGKLTISLDVLNFDGTKISGCFDARLPISSSNENTVFPLQKAFSCAGFEFDDTKATPPHHVSEDTPFIKTLLRSYEKIAGQKGQCLSIGGGTYVHNIKNGVAFGPVMSGTKTNMHGANEQIPINELLTAAKIYALAIADICGLKERI